MTRVAVALLVAAAVLPACRSGAPSDSPPPAGIAPAPIAPTPETWRDGLDGLVEDAQVAAAAGDAAGFADCEAALASALSEAARLTPPPADLPAVAGEIGDELDRLRDLLGGDDGEDATVLAEQEEGPPEPEPVDAESLERAELAARRGTFDLPVVVRPEVASLIAFYTGRHRDRFTTALARAATMLPAIRDEFAAADLPLDLAYLPLVESAFNTQARSRARAQGLWQFMGGTARRFGLRCDGLVDERNDPYLATRAAAGYLSELYATYSNWELALAAYNSGAGRVNRAIRRAHGQTDFWAIRRHLPRETRNYVPAFWAVLVVAKEPNAYGLPAFPESRACIGRTPIVGALELEVVAERVGVATDELTRLNPALTHGLTPANGTYLLAVPCGREEEFATAVATIPANERVRRQLHVVRSGETLGAIARRYGSSVDAIMAANHIKNARRLQIGQSLVVPRHPLATHGTVADATVPRRRVSPPRTPDSATPVANDTYRVRHGDTLYGIAHRHGLTVEELRRLNNLSSTVIHPGDVLKLSAGS